MDLIYRQKQALNRIIKVEKDWNLPESVMARALQFANRKLDEIKEKKT